MLHALHAHNSHETTIGKVILKLRLFKKQALIAICQGKCADFVFSS